MNDFRQQLILLVLDKLIIGGLIVLAYYFVNRAIEKLKGREALRRDLEMLRDRTALEHIQAQIEQLYSPLLSLVQYARIMRALKKERLKLEKERQQANEVKPEEYEKVERYFVEKYFLPLNTKIADLIKSKIHLIDSDEIPKSFLDFLKHQANYEGLHNLWKDEGIPSDMLPGVKWPEDLEKEVEGSLQELRKSYNDYLRRIKGVTEHLIPPNP